MPLVDLPLEDLEKYEGRNPWSSMEYAQFISVEPSGALVGCDPRTDKHVAVW